MRLFNFGWVAYQRYVSLRISCLECHPRLDFASAGLTISQLMGAAWREFSNLFKCRETDELFEATGDKV